MHLNDANVQGPAAGLSQLVTCPLARVPLDFAEQFEDRNGHLANHVLYRDKHLLLQHVEPGQV